MATSQDFQDRNSMKGILVELTPPGAGAVGSNCLQAIEIAEITRYPIGEKN